MNRLCLACNLRDSCQALCPEAKEYADQDRDTGYCETFLSSEELDVAIHNRSTEFSNLSLKDQIVLMYFVDARSQKEILDQLNTTKQYVSRIVNEIKHSIKQECTGFIIKENDDEIEWSMFIVGDDPKRALALFRIYNDHDMTDGPYSVVSDEDGMIRNDEGYELYEVQKVKLKPDNGLVFHGSEWNGTSHIEVIRKS